MAATAPWLEKARGPHGNACDSLRPAETLEVGKRQGPSSCDSTVRGTVEGVYIVRGLHLHPKAVDVWLTQVVLTLVVAKVLHLGNLGKTFTISALQVPSPVEVKTDEPKMVANVAESQPKALNVREQRASHAAWVSDRGLLRGGGI